MKILILTNLYPPHYLGGYELICQTVAEELRERGHEVVVLTSDFRSSTAPDRDGEPFVERRLRLHGFYGQPWLGIWRLRFLELHNNAELRSAVGRHQPDLVYVWNMGGLSKSLLLTLQRLKVSSVFYISDHWISRGISADVWLSWWNRERPRPRQRALRAWWKAIGAWTRWNEGAPTGPATTLRFPRIYFCSRALRESTAAAGFEVGHGQVIYCPVHRRYLDQRWSEPRPVVQRLLYVGRLTDDKGVMTALRALSLLREKFHGELSLFGSGDRGYVSGLKGFARERGLSVQFNSASPDQMPAVYREHDLLLFTSEWPEPFALTPLEAMACALPVIGTRTGGSAELFRHGENALTYTAGQPEELAACIWEMASGRSLRLKCARTAWREMHERYATPVIVDQIERFLLESVPSGAAWRPHSAEVSLVQT